MTTIDTGIIKCRLADVLHEQGVSQRQLHLKTGIRPATISNLCKGDVDRITASVLAAMCEYLQCGVGDLFYYDPYGKKNN